MPGMFSGSSGQNAYSSTNSNSSTNYSPQYEAYVNDLLAKGTSLSQTPFSPGPSPDKRFAPATPAMQTGWGNIMGNAANYMPAQNMAMSGLNTAAQTPNAWNVGAPLLGAAAMQPGGYQAAQPWMQAASQTWPGAASQYTNPFLSGAIGYGNQLATQNLMEKTLPGVMDQFVTSGGQLGRKNYNNQLSRTLRDFGNAAYGNAMKATSDNYNQLNQQFQGDQNRLANIGQTQGSLANQTMGQYGQLAQTAGGLANSGQQQGLNMASGAGNLAQQLSGLGLTNAGAQVNVGQQQQGLQQQQLDYAEQQRQAGIQWPFQMANFQRDLQSGLQIPTTQTAQSTSKSGTNNTGSTSPFGSILGGLSAVSSMGGSGGMGSVLSGIGGLFGGGSAGTSNTSGFPVGGGPQGPSGGAVAQQGWFKRGGHFSKRKANHYALGGLHMGLPASADQSPIKPQNMPMASPTLGGGRVGMSPMGGWGQNNPYQMVGMGRYGQMGGMGRYGQMVGMGGWGQSNPYQMGRPDGTSQVPGGKYNSGSVNPTINPLQYQETNFNAFENPAPLQPGQSGDSYDPTYAPPAGDSYDPTYAPPAGDSYDPTYAPPAAAQTQPWGQGSGGWGQSNPYQMGVMGRTSQVPGGAPWLSRQSVSAPLQPGQFGFGDGVDNKRGGHFSKRKAKKFAAGGHAPVVKAMSQNTKRSQQGALSRRRAAEQEKAPHGAFSGRPPPKMPPIMPMAPPAGGPPMGGPPRPPMPAMKRGGYFAGSQTRGR